MPSHPDILAIDFDGVLCDGSIEYFQIAWRIYCQIWSVDASEPPAGLAEQFYRLRPVVESGWEMPVLVRSLVLQIPEADLFSNWLAIAHQQTQTLTLTPQGIGERVDRLRDQWIASDLPSWLALHRFYPGIPERLQSLLESSVHTIIASTKQQRFIYQLLLMQNINFPESQIFGKELGQPKAQTLRSLIQSFTEKMGRQPNIWFIEDRLKTLQAIATQPDLQQVKLFLADWGYNTESDRLQAQQDPKIQLLTLSQFTQIKQFPASLC